eukprot:2496138-Rhodomonas_salina.2
MMLSPDALATHVRYRHCRLCYQGTSTCTGDTLLGGGSETLMSLRACYAMSGTDIRMLLLLLGMPEGEAGVEWGTQPVMWPIDLCNSYGMSSTCYAKQSLQVYWPMRLLRDSWYWRCGPRSAIPGTDLFADEATRIVVLTSRMRLRNVWY